MNNYSRKKIRYIVFTGLFAALTCVLTLIHIPLGNGYVHVGDSLIYISSIMLPFPCGVIAGGIGGALADLSSGYAIWAIPTLIIKCLNSLAVYLIVRRSEKLLSAKTIIATSVSGIITIVAYYFANVILYTGFYAQLAVIPSETIQAVGSEVIFILFAYALDKANIKKHLSI